MRRYKATIVAIILIAIMFLVAKFVYNDDFKREETIVEPTQAPTMRVFENTQLYVLPTEE